MRETSIINITCQVQTYVNNDGAPPEGTSGRHFYSDDWCRCYVVTFRAQLMSVLPVLTESQRIPSQNTHLSN